jgi:hypothetical protein
MPKVPPLSAFSSYSRKDEKLRAKVAAGLVGLERDELITKPWCDRKITAGTEWQPEILGNLQRADLVLLLMTNNFISSDYCMKELALALDRHQAGKARIIPIVLEFADWKIGPLSGLQALPVSGEPVFQGNKARDNKRLLDVSDGIRAAVKEICSNRNDYRGTRAPVMLGASQTVLAQLCNRIEQDRQLREAWQQHFDSFERRRRPFLCLVHGSEEEDHNGYLKRLAAYSLPQALGLGSDSEIRNPLKVDWPEYSTGETPSSSAMLGRVATALNCPPAIATVALNLYQLGQASVVYCELFSNNPSYGDREALKAFFDLWAEWPDLPVRQKLVVILSVQYRDPKRFPARFPKVETDIVTDVTKGGRVSAVILDELPQVSSQQVKEWIRRPEVENFCDVIPNAAVWEDEIDAAFLDQAQMPMEKLIGPLTRMLNEYKRRAL